MSRLAKLQYRMAILDRYGQAGRQDKARILSEFCSVCGYSRKYGIAILAGRVEPLARRPRGRHIVYDQEVV